ncbi:hypothetical protein SAMN04488103_10290 [Gemmobacter aquatilis]|uniref:Lipoprotein n=1 Tax=Gemmobacter aquatilis TaxID=933059 RepID=A0A1H8B9Y0_9RHOB|nr:DUF6778 family protein [Gemmobacter aquatilis]SEM79229.1 hypothetical protein SAMN04488103_10290 [Gemmobacter aquatilis]
MKNAIRVLVAMGLASGLSACVGGSGTVSRGGVDGAALVVPAMGGAVVMAPQYDVTAVHVTVPRDLKVSEANVFYPIADIVWRGEAPGDRYEQVRAILEDGVTSGTGAMHQGRKVNVDVELVRFHALTEKTRYTVGGVHSIKFMLTVRDAASGVALDGPRMIVADVKAAGGSRAMAEDQAGRTQRVVIVEHLAAVIRRELSMPVAVPPGSDLVSQNGINTLVLTSVK